ncbi:flavodoxin [Companilactobacillus kimchiensis]|uniref:Flavodoxin n=1 Tax=Companilactobacillus kimchiensis TaxID=993692 RepID=A0A0R2LH66_9LACO|nr:flavodoxin [Companilactobacillus kimchiensis]KRN98860.1 flavodoxin [Companilactobacillus kimchiensis]
MAADNKKVIIYFTSSGTTKRAAEKIQQATHADIFELQAAEPYPQDYEAVAARGKKEMDSKTHPEIAEDELPDFSKYDEIFVGFPTWWSQPPMIIHSLFDVVDFSGKTVIPFTTSMSSTIDDSMLVFDEMTAKDNGVKLTDGIRYDNDGNLSNFLKRNNLI